jgi:RHS repeat-associated protein
VGFAEARVPVLVRAGARPSQTDQEHAADQAALSDSGDVRTGQLQPGESPAPEHRGSLLDHLVPTAHAQATCYYFYPNTDPGDVGYDELFTDAANLVGTPPNRPLEATRIGAVNPESKNYTFAIPIYGLPGRGLDQGVVLNYNGQVWTKHGSAITFNAINGFPYAGFSIGAGRLVTWGPSNATKYLWVAPNGTRHFLGTGLAGTSATYQTADGTHITFVGSKNNGGTLYLNNGTRFAILPVNNRLLITSIKDRNGNYATISYRTYIPGNPDSYPQAFNWRQAISTITDSLGRICQFNYNSCGYLTSIDAPGFGGTSENPVTQTVARFDYQTTTITGTFSGLTVENVPAWPQNQLQALRHIYFPATNSGFLFTYSAYGNAYNVSMRRTMTYDSGTGAITDGVENAQVNFNYPVSPASLTDKPSFSQRTETPGATGGGSAVYNYSGPSDNLIEPQSRTYTVTRPDSSQLLLTRSTNAASIENGRMVHSEVKNSSGVTMAKVEYDYVADGGGSPQVQSVISYDDTNTPVKAGFDYDSHGNVTNRREYGFQVSGSWLVRRRTRLVYKTDTAYVNAYLRSFVIEANVYDAQLNTSDADDVMIAKATNTLDDYAAYSGMEDYGGTANPPGHDTTYNTSKTVRGNVTGVTQWTDIGAGTSITHLMKLDIFGNVVKAEVSCCDEKSFACTEATLWAQPSQVTNGSGAGALTSAVNRDFNTSVPNTVSDPNSLSGSYTYDPALRITAAALPAGGSSTASYNDATLTATMTRAGGGTSTEKFDGWGRLIQTINVHNGQVNYNYDAMGRLQSVTNPFTAGGAPGPQTSYQYDGLGRVTITTLPDGNSISNTYSGSSMTLTDQVSRKTERIVDGLGRLVTVKEQTSSASAPPDQATNYSYDLLDNLIQVDQGGQMRSSKYDALGRLLFERIPEQAATISDGAGGTWSRKYTYTAFNSVQTRTDARGVITTYGYDSMNRLTSISYNTGGAPSVTATNNVTLNFDNSGTSTTKGMLLSVSMTGSLPTYTETFSYDSFNRVGSRNWTRDGRSYTVGYQYSSANRLTRLTYPSGRAININRDSNGRLSSLTQPYEGSPVPTYLSNLAYGVAGQTTSWRLGDPLQPASYITETFGTDAQRQQLTSQTAVRNGVTLMSLNYGYQASAGQLGPGTTAGNTGQLMSVNGTINGATESASYTYDLLRRVATSAQTTQSASAQRRFAYDRWGNRTGVWDAVSGGTQIQSVTLDQPGGIPTNRIASVTSAGTFNYTYDSNGNVTSDGVHTYSYDAENRLTKIDNGATGNYAYDYQNRRIYSFNVHYVWEGSVVLAEHASSTGVQITDYIYANGRMIAKGTGTGPTSVNYLLRDRLSTRLTVNYYGAVQGWQGHLPNGEWMGLGGTLEKHHFTTYERDSQGSGTDYAVNRQYAPATGRFLSVDPHSGSLVKPQSLNRYGYVRNDPVNSSDPMGLDWECFPRPDGCEDCYDDESERHELRCPGDNGGPPIPIDPDSPREPTPCINCGPGGGQTTQKALLPSNLRSRLAAITSGPCGTFVRDLINQVDRNTGIHSHSTDILALFDIINGPGRGYVLEDIPPWTINGRQVPIGGSTRGSIDQLGDPEGGPQVVINYVSYWNDFSLENAWRSYTWTALHETIHMAGHGSGYSDQDLAKAVVDLGGLSQKQIDRYNRIGQPGNDDSFARFWDDILRNRCPQ